MSGYRGLRWSVVGAVGLISSGAVVSGLAQEVVAPALKGYVSHGDTLESFEVNGFRVGMTANTGLALQGQGGLLQAATPGVRPFLGESVEVYGKKEGKSHTVRADRIVLHAVESREVEGAGIIEAVSDAGTKGAGTFRADGYWVSMGPKVVVGFVAPATSAPTIATNVWATFHGRQGADGVVIADRVSLRSNVISGREDKLLTKADYDPEAVKQDSKQGSASRFFKGIDPKRVPPYDDAAMQARVKAIGEKLVPTYQKELPEGDETKLSFEFQVVDETKWRRNAHPLPNGIVLVPKQVVERLQNDSQLAAILADSIAYALEKQTYRAYPGEVGRGATNVAGTVAGVFIPGLGILTNVGTSVAEGRAVRLREEQCGRVSLFLMHDAGFDLEQAPLAWWLLASKKPKEVTSISMPRRAAYLYDMLARSWRKP